MFFVIYPSSSRSWLMWPTSSSSPQRKALANTTCGRRSSFWSTSSAAEPFFSLLSGQCVCVVCQMCISCIFNFNKSIEIVELRLVLRLMFKQLAVFSQRLVKIRGSLWQNGPFWVPYSIQSAPFSAHFVRKEKWKNFLLTDSSMKGGR